MLLFLVRYIKKRLIMKQLYGLAIKVHDIQRELENLDYKKP